MASIRNLGLFPDCANDFTGWSQEAAVAAFWRVKNWIVTDSSGNFGGGNLPPVGLVLYYKATITEGSNGASIDIPDLDETSLVCDSFVGWTNTYLFETFTIGDNTYNIYDSCGVTFEIFNSRARLAAGVGIPEITGSTGEDTGGENGDGELAGYATLRYNDAFGSQIQTIFPMFTRFSGGGSTLTLEFGVDEYWGYDPGDGGGPIYDSATGARLRASP